MSRRATLQDAEAAFGRLRDEVCLRGGDTPPQVLCVTSARRGEGRTTVATGLARAFARAAVGSTLVVDFDLRQPMLSQLLGRPTARGVSDLLREEADLDGMIQKTDGGLGLLSAGTRPAEAGMLMTASRLAPLVALLRSRAGVVIIDAPPLESGVEVQTLAAATDGALLVVKADHTIDRDARGACAALLAAGASVLGAVMNDVRRVKAAAGMTFVVPTHLPQPERAPSDLLTRR